MNGRCIMKTLKLILGILTICICLVVLFQSCAAGVSNALGDTGEISGFGGLLVAILMLTGGIVMIATRGGGKGGSIGCLIIFILAALLGFATAGTFSDLKVWASWCLIMAAVNLFALFKKKSE